MRVYGFEIIDQQLYVGYLLMGMTNDSNIGVAPVFWLLLGTGLRFLNFDKKN